MKKEEAAGFEANALELCRNCRAQRAEAEKNKASGTEQGLAMSANLHRMANLLETMAEEFFNKAKKIRGEISLSPFPALKNGFSAGAAEK